MGLGKKTIDDENYAGKRVLVRCDFNVPMKDGVITNDNRINAALPTIKKLIADGAKVILCSHLGKPKNGPEAKFSLAPVAVRLSEKLGQPVTFADDDNVVGNQAKAAVATMGNGDVVLLQNTRFRKEETKNIDTFSEELASLADAYVDDAFGSCHRAHCSTAGVTNYVKDTAVGYLMEKEIKYLGNAVNNPERPFTAILGGAKVADKLNVISNLLEKVDTLIIGGGMAYTFLKAQGYEVGTSLVDDTKIDYCKEMLEKARREHYAVPAMNTQGGNYDIIWAICRAAEEMHSPAILAHYVATGAYSGDDWFVEVCKWCANKVSVPIAIHLDHGDSFDICMKSLKNGFTSLMIDGSTKPIEENARLTNEVIKVAKCFGVPVEAEIGELLRLDEAGVQMENKNVANPEQVRQFLDLCQPDSLAIGIGNAHGYYKGEPDIKLEVLEEVRKFTDIPFVLHGCTGMREDIIKEAIKLGVAKINFGTEIRYKYVEHYEEALKTNHQGHSWKLSQLANDALTEDIKKIIRLAGSEGKA